MQQLHFQLKGEAYIQLNQLLKVLSLVGTGGEAMSRIAGGEVRVNGSVETRKRKKLRNGDRVQFANTEIQID